MQRQKQTATIVSRIVVPLLITVMVQSVLIIVMLSINGVFSQIRENSLSMLAERTQNKYQSLYTEMSLNWSYLMGTEEKVNRIVQDTLLAQNKDYGDIKTDATLNAALSQSVAGELISRMRENDTTGIFIVFNGIGVVGKPDTYAGFYVRDTDPYTDSADNSDLHVLRGLPPLTRALGLSLDSFWQASFTFPDGVSNSENDYFFEPLNASIDGIARDRLHDGYWSTPFNINGEDDGAVITYSEPLINENGEIYGVIGVELNEDYLIAVLNQGEFARTNRGCYFLGVTADEGKTYRRITTGGAKYKQFFKADDQVLTPLEPAVDERIRVKSTRNDEIIYGAVFPLKLYPTNTAFARQQWVLIGMEDETTLFAFVESIRGLFVLAALMAAALGAVVSLLTGRAIVRPIVRLVNSLKTSNPNRPLNLERTGITEIDQLADAILTQNRNVNEAAGRLTRILKLAGLPVGVFEMRNDSDTAYCSDGFFAMLGYADAKGQNSNFIPVKRCQEIVNAAMANRVEESVYRIFTREGERYVRIKRLQEEQATLGTILDVTAEMADRMRIERERDHDLLTGILNRRAFEADAEALFTQKSQSLGIAAVIMLDLDNLKFLNDNYGHDCGDGYIRAFAESLRLFGQEKSLVARRSGDEFYVLLYGGQSKEELRQRIRRAWAGILNSKYILPDGTPYKMRVSAGIAWYPDDAKTLVQLIHYADFAMYKVKRNAKGTLEEFNQREYSEESFLINGRDALDRLIDQQLVRFAVQPILSARTGEVYGYELLMRTNVRELPDPLTVLRLANAEGKLQFIERLTWMKGLETIRALLQNRATPTDAKFFINSIANQALTSEDERIVAENFAGILPRLVVEVTESEKNVESCTLKKLTFVRAHGGMIAIDDYGTGYNSEMALVHISADIVKVDLSFVHNVDTDTDKQALIQNLISYAKQRGIAVLAEGVETKDEMRTLIRFGVDYLQGYYLGAPQYQPMSPDKQLKREIRRVVGEAEWQDDPMI